jgi:hypothetical protein
LRPVEEKKRRRGEEEKRRKGEQEQEREKTPQLTFISCQLNKLTW